jgi:hypothetical protein
MEAVIGYVVAGVFIIVVARWLWRSLKKQPEAGRPDVSAGSGGSKPVQK